MDMAGSVIFIEPHIPINGINDFWMPGTLTELHNSTR